MSEADELSVIFNDEQIESYTVKGWTLRQFQALVPIILEAINALRDKGIAWEDIGEDQGKTMAIAQEMVRVLAPRADSILAMSLGISEEEAGNLDLSLASMLLIKVVSKNIEHLKNLPARIMAMVGTMSPGDS